MTEEASVSTGPLADLYAACGQEMVAVARRLLVEQGLPESVLGAEDVVQEAFTKALRAPADIREPRAYVYAVIRCDVRGAARAYRARRAQHAAAETERASCGPVQVADFSELVANRAVVHQALGLLPVQQRTAVWATKALDYTQDECAVVMQKRPGTVATHVSRGVLTLRANLIASVAAVLLTAALALWAYAGIGLQTAANGGERSGTGPRLWDMAAWSLYAALIIVGLSSILILFRVREIRRRRPRQPTAPLFLPRWEMSDKAFALLVDAAELVISEQRASTDLLSQWMPISPGTASELMAQLAQLEIIDRGSGARSRVLVPRAKRDMAVRKLNSLRAVQRLHEADEPARSRTDPRPS
ncbi:RNA polymerase sigma factor [Streptomyces sp. NPDC051993]|uniref:RNA polymerase sigma factor n=1 Tax=Streptomyces sp. NPDC051993 TaxID=3155286 RepID=UPI00342E68AB